MRLDLAPPDARAVRLAERAAELLGSAGRRSRLRGDLPAAVRFLERSAALVAGSSRGVELQAELGAALRDAGRLAEAEDVLGRALAEAIELRDERVEALASLERAFVRMYTAPAQAVPALEASAAHAITVFERHDDHASLARAWRLVAGGHFARARYQATQHALERASEHARYSGDTREERLSLWRLAIALVLGPEPVVEALRRCREIAEQVQVDRVGSAIVMALIARLHAMRLEHEPAHEAYAAAKELLAELGDTLYTAGLPLYAGPVELLLGELDEAERELRWSYGMLERLGEKSAVSTAAALLGRVALDRGELEEAARWADETARTTSADDVFAQALWRATQARVLAARAEDGAAELAREAEGFALEAQSPALQGDVQLDLALVLAPLAPSEAQEALDSALERYRAKGDQAGLARARALVAESPALQVDAAAEKA